MTTTKSTTETPGIQVFGLAVRGPGHRSEGQPCQDAWRGFNLPDGAGVAVADGLGSRPQSAHGARQATAAAHRAFREWRRHPEVEPVWFLRLLEAHWRLAVAPFPPADCSTTCLFAAWTAQAGLTVAALGDGAIIFRESGSPARLLSTRLEQHAIDETRALGAEHRLNDWTILQRRPTPPWVVILATDGIADDLDPDRLDTISDWLVNEVAPMPASQRRAKLRAALNTWPVPGHSDDKTIAALLHP